MLDREKFLVCEEDVEVSYRKKSFQEFVTLSKLGIFILVSDVWVICSLIEPVSYVTFVMFLALDPLRLNFLPIFSRFSVGIDESSFSMTFIVPGDVVDFSLSFQGRVWIVLVRSDVWE